jgi:hypothetical protein
MSNDKCEVVLARFTYQASFGASVGASFCSIFWSPSFGASTGASFFSTFWSPLVGLSI